MPENRNEGQEHARHQVHSEQQRSDRAERASQALQGLVAPQATPLYPASLLGSAKLDGRGNGPVRVALMRQAQQTHGNRAVQRFMRASKGKTNHPHETPVMPGVLQPILEHGTATQGPEAARETIQVSDTTSQASSGTAKQPHIQRYIKGYKKKIAKNPIRTKIEKTSKYQNYNAYEKSKVDGWMDSTTYEIDVQGVRDLDALLNEEKAKFDADYLASLSQTDLQDALDTERFAPLGIKQLSTEELDKIRNELLNRQRITGPVPTGVVIRDPSLTQPTLGNFVPKASSLGERTTKSGQEGKAWKQIGDSTGKGAAADELNTEMGKISDMAWTDTSGEKRVLCPGCGHALSLSQFHTDHQIPFETLKQKAWQLADYASLSPAHANEVKLQYAQFDQYFVKDTQNNWAPTNKMVSDYSNDMSNLFRICGSCNSMIGGKGTASITDWFEARPLFGTAFTSWATSTHGAATPEFFGNPTVGKGWGLAAREWVERIIGRFTDLLRAHEERHPVRLANLHSATTELLEVEEEYKNATVKTPDIEKKFKHAKGRYQQHRVSIKAGLAVEEKLSKKRKMSEYDAGSDEEQFTEELVKGVEQKFDEREDKKRKRKQRYSQHLEDRVKDPNKSPTKRTKTTDLAEEDARQRVRTLKLMALHEAAGVAYTGNPLVGTTTHDAVIGNQAKIEYQKQIADLLSAAKNAGANKPPDPIPMVPFIDGMTLDIQTKLQQMIHDAYREGFMVHFQ